jgi:cellulose synthase/poly-beta-1,6-N-acetylglucosamine synthase-like glycosyltransferase
MRVGQNPAKYVKEVEKPARVTAAVLNYIPFLSGFYAESLDVLKVTLGSLNKNTNMEYDLMVFDNGSCDTVQDYLLSEQRAGRIQYLMLSDKNLGKGGAWNQILAGAPGEIIAYADSDVQFLPDWLTRSVELLETYPNVGMVTSRPFRTKAEYFSSSLSWGKKTPEVTVHNGQMIPWETFLEFNLSLGHDEQEIREIYDSTEDVWLEYKGLRAVLGASHWQFVSYKSVLQQFLPLR